mmetsp:Transcript_55427/g.132439  ORF Transcript_55427/g.132439 Transcript_55427/m.132439 type:complete len:347 (+) Transcript_55427:1020-2060(+)
MDHVLRRRAQRLSDDRQPRLCVEGLQQTQDQHERIQAQEKAIGVHLSVCCIVLFVEAHHQAQVGLAGAQLPPHQLVHRGLEPCDLEGQHEKNHQEHVRHDDGEPIHRIGEAKVLLDQRLVPGLIVSDQDHGNLAHLRKEDPQQQHAPNDREDHVEGILGDELVGVDPQRLHLHPLPDATAAEKPEVHACVSQETIVRIVGDHAHLRALGVLPQPGQLFGKAGLTKALCAILRSHLPAAVLHIYDLRVHPVVVVQSRQHPFDPHRIGKDLGIIHLGCEENLLVVGHAGLPIPPLPGIPGAGESATGRSAGALAEPQAPNDPVEVQVLARERERLVPKIIQAPGLVEV